VLSNPFTRCAADRRTHDLLWAPERVRDADGLSRFQHRAESALGEAGHALRAREVRPVLGGEPDDLLVTGLVGEGDARVYLYEAGVEVEATASSLRLEDWDVRAPDQMIQALLTRVAELDGREG
jgi:hypothetical protein